MAEIVAAPAGCSCENGGRCRTSGWGHHVRTCCSCINGYRGSRCEIGNTYIQKSNTNKNIKYR